MNLSRSLTCVLSPRSGGEEIPKSHSHIGMRSPLPLGKRLGEGCCSKSLRAAKTFGSSSARLHRPTAFGQQVLKMGDPHCFTVKRSIILRYNSHWSRDFLMILSRKQ
jgi:hypothetical protein